MALVAACAEAVDCWQPKTILLVPWLRTVSLRSAHTTRSLVVDGSKVNLGSARRAVDSEVADIVVKYMQASDLPV